MGKGKLPGFQRKNPDLVLLALLGFLSPLFIFPRPGRTWIFLLVPFVLLWKCRREKRFFRRTLLDLAVALLMVQVLVTCFVVMDLDFSLSKISGVLYGVLLFYALAGVLDSGERIKLAVGIFIIGTALLIIISFSGMMFTQETFVRESYSAVEEAMAGWKKLSPLVDFHLPGAEEGFNANAVAGTALLGLPIVLLCPLIFWRRKGRKVGGSLEKEDTGKKILRRVSLFFLWGVFILILFLTQSIGSWLALVAAFWLVAFAAGWKKKGLIAATLLVLIVISFPGERVEKNDGRTWLTRKWETRKPLWEIGLAVVKERPLTGIGINQLRKLTMIEYRRSHAHNHFIHTAAELGIPALVAYFSILIGAGFMCVKVWRKSRDEFMRMTVLALGAGQMAHFIWGMGDSIPLGAKPGVLFWISLALIAGIYNYEMSKKKDKDLR